MERLRVPSYVPARPRITICKRYVVNVFHPENSVLMCSELQGPPLRSATVVGLHTLNDHLSAHSGQAATTGSERTPHGFPCEECEIAWSVQQPRPRSPRNPVFGNHRFSSAEATPIAWCSDSIGADTDIFVLCFVP